jgi:hypothetical protein
MTYSELTADRGMLHAVMQSICKQKSCSAIQAVVMLDEAFEAARRVAVGQPSDLPASRVLDCLDGVTISLDAIEARHDAAVRQLERTVDTPRPIVRQLDDAGRVVMDRHDAARLLADDTAATEKWLEARELGLPGTEDRDGWIADARMFARSGVDLLRTEQREQHEAEVNYALAHTDPSAFTADEPRNWRVRALAETQRLHAELFADADERELAGDAHALLRRATGKDTGEDVRQLAQEADELLKRANALAARGGIRPISLSSVNGNGGPPIPGGPAGQDAQQLHLWEDGAPIHLSSADAVRWLREREEDAD